MVCLPLRSVTSKKHPVHCRFSNNLWSNNSRHNAEFASKFSGTTMAASMSLCPCTTRWIWLPKRTRDQRNDSRGRPFQSLQNICLAMAMSVIAFSSLANKLLASQTMRASHSPTCDVADVAFCSVSSQSAAEDLDADHMGGADVGILGVAS